MPAAGFVAVAGARGPRLRVQVLCRHEEPAIAAGERLKSNGDTRSWA